MRPRDYPIRVTAAKGGGLQFRGWSPGSEPGEGARSANGRLPHRRLPAAGGGQLRVRVRRQPDPGAGFAGGRIPDGTYVLGERQDGARATSPTRRADWRAQLLRGRLPQPQKDFYDVSINPKLLKLVPQCPEGDAQRGCGLGLVVTVLAQRVLDGGALDLLDVRGQGAGGGVARVQRARIDALGRGGGVRGDRL